MPVFVPFLFLRRDIFTQFEQYRTEALFALLILVGGKWHLVEGVRIIDGRLTLHALIELLEHGA